MEIHLVDINIDPMEVEYSFRLEVADQLIEIEVE